MKNSFIVLLIMFGALHAQNTVAGTFTPASNYTFAFLYKATAGNPAFVDRARFDKSGNFSIELDSTQKPGIYKIVYAIPPEENNFDFIYDGKENVSFEFNADTGIVFTESNENKLWASYIKSMGMINQTISNYYQKDGKDVTAFLEIFKTLKDTQNAYESSAKGMLTLELIEANHPYIPESYEDISTYSRNLKNTFFDHIDFDNEFLQSSSFITDRINGYLFSVSEESSNDDYKSRVNDIAKAIEGSSQMTQLGLYQLLWNEFVQLNNDVLSTYIADYYLLELARATNQLDLVKKVEAQKRVSFGAKAPNFKVVTDNLNTTLHDLPSDKQYLLIFWSSGCSHCLKEVPQVNQLLKERKDLTVIAYALEESLTQWTEAIKELSGFIHVYGAKKWDNPIVLDYSLNATPTYFLLDKDKTIIGKPYDYEALKTLLTDL